MDASTLLEILQDCAIKKMDTGLTDSVSTLLEILPSFIKALIKIAEMLGIVSTLLEILPKRRPGFPPAYADRCFNPS